MLDLALDFIAALQDRQHVEAEEDAVIAAPRAVAARAVDEPTLGFELEHRAAHGGRVAIDVRGQHGRIEGVDEGTRTATPCSPDDADQDVLVGEREHPGPHGSGTTRMRLAAG